MQTVPHSMLTMIKPVLPAKVFEYIYIYIYRILWTSFEINHDPRTFMPIK